MQATTVVRFFLAFRRSTFLGKNLVNEPWRSKSGTLGMAAFLARLAMGSCVRDGRGAALFGGSPRVVDGEIGYGGSEYARGG